MKDPKSRLHRVTNNVSTQGGWEAVAWLQAEPGGSIAAEPATAAAAATATATERQRVRLRPVCNPPNEPKPKPIPKSQRAWARARQEGRSSCSFVCSTQSTQGGA